MNSIEPAAVVGSISRRMPATIASAGSPRSSAAEENPIAPHREVPHPKTRYRALTIDGVMLVRLFLPRRAGRTAPLMSARHHRPPPDELTVHHLDGERRDDAF